jgi:CheY-like chemotaxis protein
MLVALIKDSKLLVLRRSNIFFITKDEAEITNVKRELTSHSFDHSLHVYNDGAEALNRLMGSSSAALENYSITGKVQPEILFVDLDARGMRVLELLCLMQNYYSLQKIKVFVLSADHTKSNEKYWNNCRITGFIKKPFRLNTTDSGVQQLKKELEVRYHRAWLPFLTAMPFKIAFPAFKDPLLIVKTFISYASGMSGIKSLLLILQ